MGESLIPHCWHALERLGVVDEVAASDFVVQKNSVQFASLDGRVSKPFYFFEHTDHPCARTWQVRREEFDALLLDNATSKGAHYFPRTAVREFLQAGDVVTGVRALSTRDNGCVEIVNCNPDVRKILTISNFEQLFTIH